ncbi:salutaridine reductase-like [Macadamia integrifolia]|uniref:salutaridine reductase-like n=1 Tax=Macadamia integrifolia TaxID=60698 RepID=UPI001C4EDD1E|nr:salutaridine reductase-like [Macadamia integrifolia]
MGSSITGSAKKRIAVVTGASKGIGLETCRQLSSNGVLVILTARDEKRGIEAVENLKGSGLSHVIFHQLDVTEPSSIASMADFKTQFAKLDIVVLLVAFIIQFHHPVAEKTEECLKTNYYGFKEVTEALLPFLKLSDSPRIVNVSSRRGKLKYISNSRDKEVLSDIDCLTKERVDEVLNQFVKEFKEGSLETKGWPEILTANTVSKAAMNAYTRILANMLPGFHINCVCPGCVKTDINCNTGVLTIEEGAKSVVRFALLPEDGPSGLFFMRSEVSLFE